MSDMEIEQLRHQLAEARALLEWPEREKVPTLAEVEAGHVDWYYRWDGEWHQAHGVYVPARAPSGSHDDAGESAHVKWGDNDECMLWASAFRRCTPDGKPMKLPEQKDE